MALATLDDFHSLVQDDHVRRYLMDGQLFPRAWSAPRVRDSVSLFERRGVGLWLAHERKSGELAGAWFRRLAFARRQRAGGCVRAVDGGTRPFNRM